MVNAVKTTIQGSLVCPAEEWGGGGSGADDKWTRISADAAGPVVTERPWNPDKKSHCDVAGMSQKVLK